MVDRCIYFWFDCIVDFLENTDKNIKDVDTITKTFKNNVMTKMTTDERDMFPEFDKDFKNEIKAENKEKETDKNKGEDKDDDKNNDEDKHEGKDKNENENESKLSRELITNVLMDTIMQNNTVLLDIILTEIGEHNGNLIQNIPHDTRTEVFESIRKHFESGKNEKSLSLWMSLLYKYKTLWNEHSDIKVMHQSYLYKYCLLMKSQNRWYNLDIPTYRYDEILIDIISKNAMPLFDYLHEHLEYRKNELKKCTLNVLGNMFEETNLKKDFNHFSNKYNNPNNDINHNQRLRFFIKLFEYYQYDKKNLQQIESQIISYRYNVKIIDFFKNHQNPHINYDFTQNLSFWQSCVNKNNVGLVKHYRQEFIRNQGRFHKYPQLQKDVLSVINNNLNSFPILDSKKNTYEYRQSHETPTGVQVSYHYHNMYNNNNNNYLYTQVNHEQEMKFDQSQICESIYKNDMTYLRSLGSLSADDRAKISASDKIRGFAMVYRNAYVLNSWFSGWQEEFNQVNLNCVNDYERDEKELNEWKDRYSRNHNDYQIINHEIENAIIYFYKKYYNEQEGTFAKFVFDHIIMNKKYFMNKETKYSIDNDIAAMKSTKKGFYLFHSILRDVSCATTFVEIMNSNKIESATAANGVNWLLTVNNNNKLPIECLVYGSYNEKYQNLKFAENVQNSINGGENSSRRETLDDAKEWIQLVYKLKAETIQLKFAKIQ